MARGDMEWSEALHLTRALAKDPTSRLYAALHGWDHPWSREARILADLIDATILLALPKKQQAKHRPYKRPWPTKDQGHTARPAPHLTQAQIRAALAVGAPRRE